MKNGSVNFADLKLRKNPKYYADRAPSGAVGIGATDHWEYAVLSVGTESNLIP